jgi:hypothetical protein
MQVRTAWLEHGGPTPSSRHHGHVLGDDPRAEALTSQIPATRGVQSAPRGVVRLDGREMFNRAARASSGSDGGVGERDHGEEADREVDEPDRSVGTLAVELQGVAGAELI